MNKRHTETKMGRLAKALVSSNGLYYYEVALLLLMVMGSRVDDAMRVLHTGPQDHRHQGQLGIGLVIQGSFCSGIRWKLVCGLWSFDRGTIMPGHRGRVHHSLARCKS